MTASCVLWLCSYCDRAVAAQESCAASQALGICTLARWSSPSHPFHTIRARCAALPLLGSAICCCLGLSCSFPSVGVSVLTEKQTNNPVSESAFRSLHPFGGKNPLPIAAGAISSPQAWQRAVSVELEVLEITGVCWPLQTQHISLVPLSVAVFLRRGSKFQLKPEVSRARGNQGTACNRTETREPA